MYPQWDFFVTQGAKGGGVPNPPDHDDDYRVLPRNSEGGGQCATSTTDRLSTRRTQSEGKYLLY